jgi:hypothetical protein
MITPITNSIYMRYIIYLFLVLSAPFLNAQVYIKGVLNESFANKDAGDTVVLCGAYEDAGTQKLFYYQKETDIKIPAEKVSLLLNKADFWEVQQFYYISYKIIKYGWDVEKRKNLEQQTLDLIARLEAENKIYSDKFMEDYLQQLIQRIHYPKIWKGRDQNLSIKILNSDQKVCYAFDNGMILISTQLIANLNGEKELFRILSEAVAHILLDSNMDNIDPDSQSDYGRLGAIYSGSTKKRIQLIAAKYQNYYERNAGGEPYASDFDFLNAVAGIVSYTAWQEYYNNHYQLALEYIERLMKANLANSTDYLLKAKTVTKIVNTSDSNQQAINYLKIAASFNDQQLPEIYSDLGVLQLREKLYTDARTSFMEYYKLVSAVQDDEKMKWALKMINLCDVYLKENQTDAALSQ